MAHVAPRTERFTVEVVTALWFLPVVMAAAGVGLGVLLPGVDVLPVVASAGKTGWLRHLMDSSPESAQLLLATSAGALATVLGVAFSLTLVALQLAAAQYSARLLGSLLTDRITKAVLGAYIGTVAYLLLVLRSVHRVGEAGTGFVPRLSVLIGLVLVVGCLGLLAYFVHHLGAAMQPARLVARIGEQTVRVIEKLAASSGEACSPQAFPSGAPSPVRSSSNGYVQLVDLDRIAATLPPGATAARMEVAAGDYVLPGEPVVALWPAGGPDLRHADALLDAVALGTNRTEAQDVLYGVRLLADVALRALSPGVNDETTAVTVLDQLGRILATALRCAPGDTAWTKHVRGAVVLFTRGLTVRRIVEDAFGGITRFAADHPRVLARAVEVLRFAAAQAPAGDGRAALAEAMEWVRAAAERGRWAPHEREFVLRRLGDASSADGTRPHAVH